MIDCPPLTQPVYVDREMWEKIVLNLLSNAFKFTFEGEIEFVCAEPGGEPLKLRVRDTGTGIHAHELPHLFERFYRVKGATAERFEGSGIGLALVKELVKLHGGTVTVTSRLNEGSTFTVTSARAQSSSTRSDRSAPDHGLNRASRRSVCPGSLAVAPRHGKCH